MSFYLSNLYKNNGYESFLIINFSNKIIHHTKLSEKEIIHLGKTLDFIQKKTLFDQILDYLSHITTTTRKWYLFHRVKNYTKFIMKNKNVVKLEEIFKERQKKLLLEQLKSNLHLIPSSEKDKELAQEKIDFMTQQMDSTHLQKIINGYHFPIIQDAMRQLSDKYEEWDEEISEEEKQEIQKELKELHTYLESLSKVLTEVEEEESERALMEITPERMKEMIEGSEVFELSEKIKDVIEQISQELLEPLTLETLEAQRAASPISKKMIELNGNLFSVMRRVKLIALEKNPEDLKAQENSLNTVIPFQDSTKTKDRQSAEKTIAYYKEGRKNEEAVGEMEKLMWELAGLMGFEESFAPTTTLSIRTRAEAEKKGKSAIQWTKEGELSEQEGLSSKRQGGIQIAQQGMTLEKWRISKSIEINRDEVIKGTLITLVFGMFDAHSSNIFVEETGSLKFFDNTRSMPHSNGVIQWGQNLISAYRSGLLEHEENFERLTSLERDHLKIEIAKYQSQIKKIEQFLKSDLIQKRLKNFPSEWMNSEDSLEALKERVDHLASAIENPDVMTLHDLVFETLPDFKYFSALHLFLAAHPEIQKGTSVDWYQMQKDYFSEVGYEEVNQLISKTAQTGVDPAKVLKWCQDPTLSLSKILDNMVREYRKPSHQKDDRETLQNNANQIIQNYRQQAKLDFKDIPRTSIPYDALQIAKQRLADAGFTFLKTVNPRYRLFIKKEKSSPSVLFLYYRSKTNGNLKKIKIDYLIKPGFLKVGNQILTADELMNLFQN